MENKSRTLPFRRVKMKARGACAVTHSEGNNNTMANFTKLLTDVPAEATAVKTFVEGVEKLVTDAKAVGLSTVAISDVEALVPEGEAVIQDGENIATDI